MYTARRIAVTTLIAMICALSAHGVLVIDQQNPGPGGGAIGLTAGVGMGQMTGHDGVAGNLARVDVLLSGSTSTSLTLNVWQTACDQCWLGVGSPSLLDSQTITNPPNGGIVEFNFPVPIDLSGVPTIDEQHRLMLELVAPDSGTGVSLTSPAATYSGNLFADSSSNGQLNNDFVFTTYGDIPPEVSFEDITVTNAAAMRFASVSGVVYSLEFTTSLTPPTNWIPTGCTIEGDGTDKTVYDPTAADSNKTYRILAE
jgi:hypothetical protein